ncbi:MAG: hypothetical protein IKU79_02825 [Bacteroidaceae bacterium]|nr:hypothetical protein [Bacteroidaceae bacterium]
MQEDDEDYFNSDDFLDILHRYEHEVTIGQQPYMDCDELIDVADYYMSKGRHEDAKQATILAMDLYPEAEDPVTMMADIFFETQHWSEAVVWLNKVLDNTPFDIQAWLNITDAQIQCDQFAEALESTEYALAIQPSNNHALLQKAYALSRMERFKEADEWFHKYLSKCPEDELALYHSAFNLCFLEQYEEANEMLIKAEQLSQGLSPEHLNICLQRSYTEARIGHQQEALDALERAKGFNDPYTQVDYNILTGHIHLLFSQKEKAIEYFSQALHDSKNLLMTMRNIAQIFMDCQDFVSATKIVQEIEEAVEKPEYQDMKEEVTKAIYPVQAYCYYQTGHKAEFVHYLQKAIELNPKDTQFFFKDIFPLGAKPEEYMFYIDSI